MACLPFILAWFCLAPGWSHPQSSKRPFYAHNRDKRPKPKTVSVVRFFLSTPAMQGPVLQYTGTQYTVYNTMEYSRTLCTYSSTRVVHVYSEYGMSSNSHQFRLALESRLYGVCTHVCRMDMGHPCPCYIDGVAVPCGPWYRCRGWVLYSYISGGHIQWQGVDAVAC